MSHTPISDERNREEGFTLAALIVILTIIAIVIAYTVPTQWSIVMKRERDRQTIFLMKQYARGILAFQKKHNNTLPVSLEQLQKAKEPRLIRGGGAWPNPLTGDPEGWILVPPGAVQGGAAGPGGPAAGTPGGPIIGGNPALRPGAQQPGQAAQGPSKLNKDLSPKDYVGPFVGVRPNATGESFIALNGAEDYSEWVYTVQDLQNEIMLRQQALAARP